MSLKSRKELFEKFYPDSEMGRINKVTNNRKLLVGDFSPLGIPKDSIKVNWFRRVARFFPEFLYSEEPQIYIEGNPRFTSLLEEMKDDLIRELTAANESLIAFGSAVVATHPESPFHFESFSPDDHFQVCDEAARVTEDLLVRIRGASGIDRRIDVYSYPVDAERPATWGVYRFDGASIGPKILDVPIPDRRGNQVVVMESGEGSTFDAMRDSVREMSEKASDVSESVSLNSRPQLFGPAGAFPKNEEGEIEFDRDASFFIPMQPNDPEPGFLNFDPPHSAASWLYQKSEMNALVFSSLNPLLFDPKAGTGSISGRTLKRLILPTLAKLKSMERINVRAIKNMIRILNENRRNAGLEFWNYSPADVKVEFKYDHIFEDLPIKPDQDEVEIND